MKIHALCIAKNEADIVEQTLICTTSYLYTMSLTWDYNLSTKNYSPNWLKKLMIS
jgi:hypothetical protein